MATGVFSSLLNSLRSSFAFGLHSEDYEFKFPKTLIQEEERKNGAEEVPEGGLAMGNGMEEYFSRSFQRVVSCLAEGKKVLGERFGVVEEDAYGGVDVVDASSERNCLEGSEEGRCPGHLIVMVNGIIGSSEDWKFASQQFVKKLPDKVVVHRSECNYSTLTFDGVDTMGERLADEVKTICKDRPGLEKISFVAHSLGGLVARYAIGRLYDFTSEEPLSAVNGNCCSKNEPEDCKWNSNEGRIAGLMPMNFLTFATPHLGSRGNKQLPLLCGLSFLESKAPQTAHLFAGRTGKHLFLTDNDDGKRPLLLRMVEDQDDIKFISALRSFKRRVAYANVGFDHMVGWRTSSIRRQAELPKESSHLGDERYPHVVNVETEYVQAAPQYESLPADFEDEMIRGLTQVPWERADVSFQSSKQRYLAHNTIHVKSYWMNSDGADVIFHMIDNFVV